MQVHILSQIIGRVPNVTELLRRSMSCDNTDKAVLDVGRFLNAKIQNLYLKVGWSKF